MKTNKRFLFVAISVALAFAPAVVFAQQEQDLDSMQRQQLPQQQSQQQQQSPQLELVSELIKEDLIGNKEAIKRESSQLSDADRWYLYRKHRTKAAGWAALNFFPGFGLGSYLQGDLDFGVLQSVFDLNGSSIIFFAIQEGFDDKIGVAVLASGVTIAICSRIMGVVYPHVYKTKRNKHLSDALNNVNYKKFSYSLDPLIVPRQGGETPALGLGFNVRY